jgi:virginiamycin B lyase
MAVLLATIGSVSVGSVRADTTQIAEFPVPGAGQLSAVATGFNAVWVMDSDTATGFPKISKIDPDTGTVLASYTGPTKGAGWIITGLDAVWYSLENDGSGGPGEVIGKLDPDTGLITEFALPAGGGASRLATGFEHVWYTDPANNLVGRLDPGTGVVTTYPIPTADSTPVGIATGFGFVWFGEVAGEKIGRLDPNTGAIKEFTVAEGRMCCEVAIDFGAVWFNIHTANLIGRLDPNTGQVTTYTIPTPASNSFTLIAGPHASVWFTESVANKIGRLDPTTGAFTEYTIPTSNSAPWGLAPGSIWFVESNTATVGRLHVDRFSDDNTSTFELDIEWMAAEGITKGCNPPTNDRFCPDSTVTRGQMAAFLVRALGLTDDGGGNLFTDDDESIFEGDIDRMATAGITKGCNPPDNDRFCPDSKVTRGQMAAFLVRALGYTDDGGGDLFNDDDGSVFEGDIDRLGTAGVTKGCNPPANDRYCPDSAVTRGQMAAFLHRALG